VLRHTEANRFDAFDVTFQRSQTVVMVYSINNVTCMPISRHRHGKHIPAERTLATEGRPLLGNGPVNTPP
jgi:hypothetical protein